MKEHWLPLATAAALLGMLGTATPAAAQGIMRSQTDTSVNAVDNQARQGMQEVRTDNGVTYISGGVGTDAVQALREVKGRYNLHLLFAVQGSGEYLSNVRVRLADQSGNTVLDTVADGPYFFAKVRPGKYQVVADSEGRTMTRAVDISANGSASESFYWRSAS
jgi:hypothetical protein